MDKTPARNLLSNGLPYEFIVSKTINELGYYSEGPYEFLKIFSDKAISSSIDNWFYVKDSDEIGFEFLIECKFARPEKSWVFFSNVNETMMRPTSLSGIIPSHGVDPTAGFKTSYLLPRKEPLKTHIKNRDVYLEYMSFGIELDKNSSDNFIIKKAANQLQWALHEKLLRYIWYLYEVPKDMRNDPIKMLVPVILTNAPLLEIAKDVTLEDLKTKPIHEITKRVEFLPLHVPMSGENLHASLETFKYLFTDQFLQYMHQDDGVDIEDFTRVTKNILRKLPEIIWVTNDSNLKNFIEYIAVEAKKWKIKSPN